MKKLTVLIQPQCFLGKAQSSMVATLLLLFNKLKSKQFLEFCNNLVFGEVENLKKKLKRLHQSFTDHGFLPSPLKFHHCPQHLGELSLKEPGKNATATPKKHAKHGTKPGECIPKANKKKKTKLFLGPGMVKPHVLIILFSERFQERSLSLFAGGSG